MCNKAHNMICQQTYPPRQEEGMLLCHYYFLIIQLLLRFQLR